jgi:hypothetical protein
MTIFGSLAFLLLAGLGLVELPWPTTRLELTFVNRSAITG